MRRPGFVAFSVDGDQPAISLGLGWRLERVFMAMKLEGEIIKVTLGHVRHLTLQDISIFDFEKGKHHLYQIQDAGRMIFVLGALGEE